MSRKFWVGMWMLCVLFPGVGSLAAEGRTEINQTSAIAGGGFPVNLGVPGSYVLTSDLAVPADVDALVFSGSGTATLDLNGFEIAGTATCTLGNCASGQASGVVAQSGSVVTVRNGAVRGFSDSCIDLAAGGFVDAVYVASCGRHGISIAARGFARANRVENVGETGIELGADSIYAHNIVTASDRQGSGARAIERGSATSGNLCDDGSCSRRGTRRYYLTLDEVAGDGALTACDPGFHMASIHEIWDYSSLEYDTSRGASYADAGEGPPATIIALKPAGWARTGEQSLVFEFNRVGNCGLWTSGSASDSGGIWKFSNAPTGEDESERWRWSSQTCEKQFQVWCVED